jgi:competence protein ComEA
MRVPELLRPPPPESLRDRLARSAGALPLARAAVGLGSVLLAAAAGWWLLRPGPAPVEERLPFASAPMVPEPVVVTTVPAEVVVQAAGAVHRPGVYRLAAGARVTDLIDAAGGALDGADLQALSLAAMLGDGQRVRVPLVGEQLPASELGGPASGAAGGTGGASREVPGAPIDLNTATLEDLDMLPGVGPATAQAIVAHREEHGPFGVVEDLLEVRGIGDARLEALRDLVVV